MTKDQIMKARSEAKRFLEVSAKRLPEFDGPYDIMGKKASGATRRSSMDLTRALAEMRRGTRWDP